MATAPVRRSAAAAPARRPAAPVSSGYRGAAGVLKMEQEQVAMVARREAAQMNANMPFRLFVEPASRGGGTREVVVIDNSLEEAFFRFEHNLQNKRTEKWSIFCACIQEDANCPVCKASDRAAYFALYLTVIDLTPYTNKDDVEIPWSKKLLVVKPAQQKKFRRLATSHGTLRGMVLALSRDGDKDAQIGNDIEFVEFMSEDDLLTYETVYEYTDGQGKPKSKDIIGHEPFDYDALFPRPTEQQLRAIVGGSPDPGSREADDEVRSSRGAPRASRGDDWDAPATRLARGTPAPRGTPRRAAIDPDDLPDAGVDPDSLEAAVEEAEAAVVPSRGRMAGRPATPASRPAARRPAADPEPEEEPEEEPELPARRAAARPAAPAPRVAARRPAADPEPEEGPPFEEEPEQPPRRAAARPAAAPTARPAGRPTARARVADPEPEYEEAPRQSLAERRRALRR